MPDVAALDLEADDAGTLDRDDEVDLVILEVVGDALARDHPVVRLKLFEQGLVDLALGGVGEAGSFVRSDGHCVGKRRWSTVRAKRIRNLPCALCSMVSTESRPLGRLPCEHWLRPSPRSASDLSVAVATFKRLQSGRLFGYLARRPGNRATTARCPRGRAGTRRVQEVGARGWRCRNGEKWWTKGLARRTGRYARE